MNRGIIFGATLFAALVGTLVLTRPHTRAEAPSRALVVIVAAGFAEHDISLALLRRIFGGTVTDFGGARMLPFNYAPEHPLRHAFDQSVLGMTNDAISAYWIDRRIRGQGMPPRAVPSQLVMRAVAAKLGGAIGYVMEDQVDASVVVLTIDGKRAKSPHYALRLK